MKAFRYNTEVQEFLGSKTKPEPWLHVICFTAGLNNTAFWAIYVWDTRQVVEEGVLLNVNKITLNTSVAKDNQQMVVGAKHPAIKAAFDNRAFGVDARGNIVTVYVDGDDARARVGKDKQVRKVVAAITVALDKPDDYMKR